MRPSLNCLIGFALLLVVMLFLHKVNAPPRRPENAFSRGARFLFSPLSNKNLAPLEKASPKTLPGEARPFFSSEAGSLQEQARGRARGMTGVLFPWHDPC